MASPQQVGASSSKRPRLSLQTKSSTAPTTRVVKAYSINPSDPTTFNTLSNAYVTAIERSSAMLSEPITAINTLQAFTLDTPVDYRNAKPRVVTPYIATFSGTPLTAHPVSPSQTHLPLPSTMTATPPLSAETSESASSSIFTFSSNDIAMTRGRDGSGTPSLEAMRPRSTVASQLFVELGSNPPYYHPRSLHSILRNSPLPPRTAIPPPSPRRQSLRLQERAAKRVGYNSPLTQEIVTNKYVKSHIELLSEEASPNSPYSPIDSSTTANLPLSFTANEIRDGGRTPNPFDDEQSHTDVQEEEYSATTPATGSRKRRRIERKRQWVWTIGQDDEDETSSSEIKASMSIDTTGDVREPAEIYAVKVPDIGYLETPTPSVESASSVIESVDASMSDTCSLDSTENAGFESDAVPESELDLKTPVAPRQSGNHATFQRDTPVPEACAKRDTPVPPELT